MDYNMGYSGRKPTFVSCHLAEQWGIKMRMIVLSLVLIPAMLIVTLAKGETLGGWRGNGTGLWKQGATPLQWHRLPQGALQDLRSQVNRPTDDKPSGALVEKGQIREWLVLGP